MEIFDDFLPRETHEEIETTMCGYQFPWYFNNSIIYKENDLSKSIEHFQFTHIFYMSGRPASDYFQMVEPLIGKMKIRSLIRMKANLVTRGANIEEHGYHTDNDYADAKTAVFYVNSNDGYTTFADGQKVRSIANRLVTFPSNLEHSGTNCTDKKTRVVININYF